MVSYPTNVNIKLERRILVTLPLNTTNQTRSRKLIFYPNILHTNNNEKDKKQN